MFLARDRKRFAREVQALVAGTGGAGAKDKSADLIERMNAANDALESVIGPMLEAYAELIRNAGRSAEFKTLEGSAEGFPLRAAVAEFWLDVTEVPGVAQYFLRLESVGDDWTLTSRPALDRKRARHEPCHVAGVGYVGRLRSYRMLATRREDQISTGILE